MTRAAACLILLLCLSCGEAPAPPAPEEGRRISLSDKRSALQKGAAKGRRRGSSLVANAVTLTSPYGFEMLVPGDWKRSGAAGGIAFQAPGDKGRFPTLTLQISSYRNEKGLELIEKRLIKRGGRHVKLGGGAALWREWTSKLSGRSCRQLCTALPDTQYLEITFACPPRQVEALQPLFQQMRASFSRVAPRKPSSGFRLYRHPIGLSLEIPRGWRGFVTGRRVLFAPAKQHPIKSKQTVPIALAITTRPPKQLSSFSKLEIFLQADFEKRKIKLRSSPARQEIGGREAWRFSWHDAKKRQRVEQLCLFHHGSLVALTLTRQEGQSLPLDDLFARLLNSVRLQ